MSGIFKIFWYGLAMSWCVVWAVEWYSTGTTEKTMLVHITGLLCLALGRLEK